MLSPERRSAIEEGYVSLQPMILQLKGMIPPVKAFLDIGSGEGLLSTLIARDLSAKKVFLVDQYEEPHIPLPSNAEFHRFDIQSTEFVQRFQNKVDLVMCRCAFHEFTDPIVAVLNILGVLPLGAVAMISDYSEEGWRKHRVLSDQMGPTNQLHFQIDMANVAPLGLHTNSGIKSFWEEMFRRLPGECIFSWAGELYNVIYLPRRWGEVKQPPPEVIAMMEKLRK